MMILKRSAQLAIFVLLVASFKFGWNYLQSGGIFPISVVKVESNYTHVSPENLQQTISNDLPASFWTVDIRSLKNRLQAIAWVQSVDIQKIWPETLKIRVNEKNVIARWGRDGLLSDKEEIFYPDDNVGKTKSNLLAEYEILPILYGPVEQAKNVMRQYSMMQKMLSSKDMTIKLLYLSQSGSWSVRLTNGTMLLLGKDVPLKRLSRFLRAYDSVFVENGTENSEIRFARRVDLRYPHGMAISWEQKPIKENKESNAHTPSA